MAAKEHSQGHQSPIDTSHPPVQPQVAVPQPQVFVSNPTTAQRATPQVNHRFKIKAGQITGALQIVCGGLSVILTMAALYSSGLFYSIFNVVAWPLWAGVLVR